MVICILGPTGVGKTKLSIEIAKIFKGEIINADSTQVYRGLDIATAKIKSSEKEGIPHHLFDIRNIDEDYSVYDYQKDCRLKIKEIESRGNIPILVGGTGLYIKAALYDYNFNEESECPDYSSYSNQELYDMLKSIDKNIDIHINNRKRLERTLTRLSNYENNDSKKSTKLLYDTLFIELSLDRDILYDRINKRVDFMVQNGLIDEAKNIYETNIRSKAVMTPIGYKELFKYFDGEISLNDAIDLIKQRSRRYAKRQETWNRHQMNTKKFNVDLNNFDNTLNEVNDYIQKM